MTLKIDKQDQLPEFVREQIDRGEYDAEFSKHVSETWLAKCISVDEFQKRLEIEASGNEDVLVDTRKMELETFDELQIADRTFKLSEHSLTQLYGQTMLGLGDRIRTLGRNVDEIGHLTNFVKARFQRWQADQSMGSRYLVRTRGDSIRAILSDGYKIVDNRFLVESQLQAFGTSRNNLRVSDHYGNGDYAGWSFLIGDSALDYSNPGQDDFGGELRSSNSEIGLGRYTCLPSLFRFICRNGCRWGVVSEKQYAVSGVHRGKKASMELLRAEIILKVREAIPLASEAINQMLELKQLTSEVPLPQLVASVGKEYFELPKTDILSFVGVCADSTVGKEASAYTLLNAITRHAQSHGPIVRSRWEDAAGSMLGQFNAKPQTFDRIVQKATEFDWTWLMSAV
jgi:hypothetical protein